jgi:hypothetical protein
MNNPVKLLVKSQSSPPPAIPKSATAVQLNISKLTPTYPTHGSKSFPTFSQTLLLFKNGV